MTNKNFLLKNPKNATPVHFLPSFHEPAVKFEIHWTFKILILNYKKIVNVFFEGKGSLYVWQFSLTCNFYFNFIWELIRFSKRLILKLHLYMRLSSPFVIQTLFSNIKYWSVISKQDVSLLYKQAIQWCPLFARIIFSGHKKTWC